MNFELLESKIIKTCRELGMAVVAFSPIGRGILTGQFQAHTDLPDGDLRRTYPKYAEGKLEKVAKAHGSTPAQAALAWLLCQCPYIFPIPGTKTPARMDENAAFALLQLED